MLKENVQKFFSNIQSKLTKVNWHGLFCGKITAFCKKIFVFICSWWHIITLLLVIFLFLYYPLGGFLIHNINNNTEYEIGSRSDTKSSTVDMMAFLINREVNEHLWTANLPFFFPSYILDNMPNYQLGMISGISTVTKAMSKKLDRGFNDNNQHYLKDAAKLLAYDGRIWLFSPDNHFTTVPSANSQYQKARKFLIEYNQELITGHLVFYKSPEDLAYIIKKINRDLTGSLNKIEVQIREENTSLFDFKADDVFFYNQGKIYVYSLLLKTLSRDYQTIIVDNNVYQLFTQSIKATTDGALLDPLIIRNGELNSISAPNHLLSLAFYIAKTININNSIIKILENDTNKRIPHVN